MPPRARVWNTTGRRDLDLQNGGRNWECRNVVQWELWDTSIILIIIIIIIIIIESKRRLCKQHEETIDHLTSGCPILAKNGYLMRHDTVCTHLHYSICKPLGIETTDKRYTHMPKPVCEE